MMFRAHLLLAAILLLGCADAPVRAPKLPARKARAAKPRAAPKPEPQTPRGRLSEREAVIDDVPDPEAKRLFEQRLASDAIPTGPATARVTGIALEETARGEAQGMTPMGEAVEAALGEGKRMMVPITLAGGECVTFIAQGGIGVIEVDLFLVLADRTDGVHVVAQDAGTGPIAVIGGHGHCYQNPRDTPLAVEVHATARRGSGAVLVRGYRGPSPASSAPRPSPPRP